MADTLKPDPIDPDAIEGEDVDAALLMKRSAERSLVEDNKASHQGGAGAQGGAADFGSAGNLAGMRDTP
jgi:hypothetical protein